MNFKRITEQDSHYDDLETLSVNKLISGIHKEDIFAIHAVGKVLDKVKSLISAIEPNFIAGGRIFYIGAGTSGRLGVLDASECPPTFGTSPGKVVGILAGGVPALYQSIESAEDDKNQGWKDLMKHKPTEQDFIIGIAASGTTPYVTSALKECQKNNIKTGCITSNPGSPLTKCSDYPVEVVVGPEFLTGSSRMKSGTAQKLILNMITTASMIRFGRVKGNKMIDIQITNDKLEDRAARILMEELNIDIKTSIRLLEEHKSIRAAIKNHK
jgi:N-acetylmuramic acid 6-phosphate etherase